MSSVSSTVDGLVSGLDTSSIISSLMQVDSAPQTQLKTSVSTLQAKVTAFQSVNTKMSALQTAAENLTKASTWASAKATSSATGVTATASSSSLPGSLSVFVDKLASARSVVTVPVSDDDADMAGSLGLPLSVYDSSGNLKGTIPVTQGPMDKIAAQINKLSAQLGITAVAVRVDTGQYRLQITGTSTGDDAGFKLVPGGQPYSASETSTITTVSNAQSAHLFITSGEKSSAPSSSDPNVIEVKSTTNTFTDLMKGVTATVSKTGAATVTVATDTDGVAAAVKGLVDAANAALTEISSQSKTGVTGSDGTVTGAGALNGDSTLRALKNQILSTVTTALGGTTSAAKYGIQTTRDGALTFNKDTFLTGYTADPTAAQQLLAPTSLDSTAKGSLTESLLKVAKAATNARTGSLTTAISGENSTISSLQDKIADWETRLALKKERYQTYYSNLEVALGKLQNQSTWLSGQLSSLG